MARGAYHIRSMLTGPRAAKRVLRQETKTYCLHAGTSRDGPQHPGTGAPDNLNKIVLARYGKYDSLSASNCSRIVHGQYLVGWPTGWDATGAGFRSKMAELGLACVREVQLGKRVFLSTTDTVLLEALRPLIVGFVRSRKSSSTAERLETARQCAVWENHGFPELAGEGTHSNVHITMGRLTFQNGTDTGSDDVFEKRTLVPRTIDPEPLSTGDERARPPPLFRSRGFQLEFPVYPSAGSDPLARRPTDNAHLPTAYTSVHQVDVVSTLLGHEPSHMSVSGNDLMAIWTDTAVTYSGSTHCASVWGAPYFVLTRDSGVWTGYEYSLVRPDDITLSTTHSHLKERSLPHLAALSDHVDGVSVGTTMQRIRDLAQGSHSSRQELLEYLGRVPYETLSRQEGLVGSRGYYREFSLRDSHLAVGRLAWAQGTGTGPDDVKTAETAKQRRARKREDVAHRVGAAGGAIIGDAIAPGLGKHASAAGGYLAKLMMRGLNHYVPGLRGSGSYTMSNNGKKMKVNSLYHGPKGLLGNSTFESENCNFIAAKDMVMQVRNHALSVGSFLCIPIPINAGDSNRFPRLAALSKGYEEYKPLGIALEYKASFSSAFFATGTTGTVGNIAFAVERNVGAPPPTSMEDMARREAFAMNLINADFMYFVECAPEVWGDNMYMVRQDGDPQSSTAVPLNKYDCCTLYVAIQCGNSIMMNDLLGYLFAVTHMCVSRPTVAPVASGRARFSRSGYTNASPLGVAGTESKLGSLNSCYINGNTLFFPSVPIGTLLEISFVWYGSSTAITYPALTSTTMSAFNGIESGAASAVGSPQAGGAGAVVSLQTTWTIVGASNVLPNLTLGGSGVLPSSGVRVEVFVSASVMNPVYNSNT